MIHFFGNPKAIVIAVETNALSEQDIERLNWLFGNMPLLDSKSLKNAYIGPRAAMITPWSTNATEITQNMGIKGISRIEKFQAVSPDFEAYDPMLTQKYDGLNQNLFTIELKPDPIIPVKDIAAYNLQEGLALSDQEVRYLETLAQKMGRDLTDSEVFGFSQVNSEHCRHKIFNGTFVIDGKPMEASLFDMIRKTSRVNPNGIVSAYKDNVAFVKGPEITQFAPKSADKPDYYQEKDVMSVLSLKAETHNFPTTVEPFNGAATGSGGEIRDRLAGGKGSLPLAGTAVYMTAYPRLEDGREWEENLPERAWLYQTPLDILIKASNGASDFGNKFGQPLISGSVLTFEHKAVDQRLAFDKVIMLAGGVGYGKAEYAQKDVPRPGDKIIILGGDNYRIGMGGAAVSSADTGSYGSVIELNAVQRSNPEMQKRAANAIRGMVESDNNPIVSIHDHGAGGHLNCLSELVEDTGGTINMDKLPVGDPTLSAKEIVGNESQERMGLILEKEDLSLLKKIAERERAPMYEVGEVSGDNRFSFGSPTTGETPISLELSDMFGNSPDMKMVDSRIERNYQKINYSPDHFETYLEQLLQLEAVACKDWLTNKVDRCVGGLVAVQQCTGSLQLPLNNCGVMALDYRSKIGIATAIGHAPVSALVDPVAGSRNSIAEALSNIIWAPLDEGLSSVSLSANWMWPCNNPGEDARLYDAVNAVSEFAIELGINVPTGKDSLSMKQRYPDGEVLAPGTVIISAAAQCRAVDKVVEPVLKADGGTLYYINLSGDQFKLGGSSFAQIRKEIGDEVPTIKDVSNFKAAFSIIQELINTGEIQAGHDVAAGGLITTLLELCFADKGLGASLDFNDVGEDDPVKLLFSENCGIVFQSTSDTIVERFNSEGVRCFPIGRPTRDGKLKISVATHQFNLDVAALRDTWYKTSYLLDRNQTLPELAEARFANYKNQPLTFSFPTGFKGTWERPNITSRPKAAILREKGSNSEREMANAMFMAGFDVKDVHMTDLISGRETLEDIQFIGAVGGFSNSDVLGSAKGWAGAFKYNPKANKALMDFFAREDTLSVGICNGCQLFMELELIYPEHQTHGKLGYNDSGKHESNFTSVTIEENNSVMLSSLAGSTLGVWISHGEGKFILPDSKSEYCITATYGYPDYPANPNNSDFNTAMLCDKSGRHLVTMPHIERSIFSWNWAYYPEDRNDGVSPWMEAFRNAFRWVREQQMQTTE